MSETSKANKQEQAGDSKPRRDFLIKSLVGAAGAAGAASLPLAAGAATAPAAADASAGYAWLKPDEQSFVEALVNHMCPADKTTPNGVDLGLNIYFDRALAGNWGQGDRLYLQGPFKKGTPNQGYQLGLTPAALFRAGTEGLAAYCGGKYRKPFDTLAAADKEEVLKGMQAGKIELPNGVPAATYFAQLLQMFYEAMFADPIYGGNRNKAGWKMVGYPGVNTANKLNIVKFQNKPYNPEPSSIADLS
ncbi:MAG TPA: gluconate 2-dehydrogenase subunit 3 family protein [Janthinobacterium sp.]|jgi:gluconate 2-dehydrogenase gamma chain|nr:gluconate 2-dehydrogenase subunit 3 family protein [Janthinobacterium sp.]